MKFFIFICCLFFINLSQAGNLSFLNYSAFSYFEGDDEKLMTANAFKALNTLADGKKSIWKNPNTGAWGYAIPSHTTKQNDITCRAVTLYNNVKEVTGEETYKLCRYHGQWRFSY